MCGYSQDKSTTGGTYPVNPSDQPGHKAPEEDPPSPRKAAGVGGTAVGVSAA
jgi:hypothetical protein